MNELYDVLPRLRALGRYLAIPPAEPEHEEQDIFDV
jgi:hypothetical protein